MIGALGDFMNIKIHACVGGTAVRDDIRDTDHPVGKILAEELEGSVKRYLAERSAA